MSSVGAELRVSGMVQGVGYRYFCYRKANDLGITGWVKNQPNGSVLILAEGDRSAIEAFIVELKMGPAASSVSDVNVEWLSFSGEMSEFKIEMGY